MTDDNLPPGVTTSMLPGWRPEDDEDFDPEADYEPDYEDAEDEPDFGDDFPLSLEYDEGGWDE